MQQALKLETALNHFESALQERTTPGIFAGADGFIDEIIDVVDKRYSAEKYDRVKTISDYAGRLAEAAGKSTNVEFVVKQIKAGGNGPLMSEAFGRLGGRVRYVGNVGYPEIHPLFKKLLEFGPVTSIAPAASTLATEFDDGKIMHGKHEALREVTWDNMVERMGGLDMLDEYLAEADLCAIVNWTMLPFLTDIFRGISSRVAKLEARAPRYYFFDLCDPEKRTHEDLVEALGVIATFNGHGRTVVLGLNEKESLEVCEAMKLEPGPSNHEGLMERAETIARKTGIGEIMIHPTFSAAAWNNGGQTGCIDGPFCSSPYLTTGAGDHFNGGYMFARIIGLEPQDALVIGKCVSGFYVRQGRGPSAEETIDFAKRWLDDSLDPWERLPD